jgi:hypothetical protein
VWLIICSLQAPAAERDGRIVAQGRDLEIRKGQRAHFGAVGIFLFVAIEQFLPAALDVVAGNKNRLVGVPITVHEPVDVAAIPGVLLRVENVFDFADSAFVLRLNRCRSNNYDAAKNSECNDAYGSHGVGVGEGRIVDAGVGVGPDAVGVAVCVGVAVGVVLRDGFDHSISSSSETIDSSTVAERVVVDVVFDVELEVDVEEAVDVPVG